MYEVDTVRPDFRMIPQSVIVGSSVSGKRPINALSSYVIRNLRRIKACQNVIQQLWG